LDPLLVNIYMPESSGMGH